jgi:hypothetical protein
VFENVSHFPLSNICMLGLSEAPFISPSGASSGALLEPLELLLEPILKLDLEPVQELLFESLLELLLEFLLELLLEFLLELLLEPLLTPLQELHLEPLKFLLGALSGVLPAA